MTAWDGYKKIRVWKTYERFISGIFHKMFSDHSRWPATDDMEKSGEETCVCENDII